MPKFNYTAKDSKGATLSAETEAYDKKSLVEQLQQQGLFIIKVEEIIGRKSSTPDSSRLKSRRKFHHRKIQLIDQLTFANQLTTMIESGVTLLRSLEVISEQAESEEFYKTLVTVTKDVETGSSLSEAMAEHPKAFNQFWISLVEVGEASGTMPLVLSKLAFYLEQQAAFRSTIFSAIMYPIVLFFICIGAIAFFALFVGPKFESIFNSMGVDLPLITQILLIVFRFIKEKFLLLVLSTIGFFFLLKKYIKTPMGRRHFESFLFTIPTIGGIYKLIVIERFTSQMSILVESGVPILYALDISERLVNNVTCAKVINDIKESVRQGELLVAPMQRSGFFPNMAIQMITVGEETGELSKMLKHVAAYYQETVATFMKRLGTLIEPFMLVFMGGVIGVIVVAMFMPLFDISKLAGGG